MLDRMKGFLGRKSGSMMSGLIRAKIMGRSFSEQCDEGYAANGYVMRCIRMRAEAVSAIPLILYADRTKEREIERHRLLELLDSPNEEDSWPSLVEDFVGFRQLSGNSYMYAPPVTANTPRELYALTPGATVPNVVRGQLIGYRYSSEQGQQTFMPQDVAHWMCWNPRDSNIGLSPLASAAYAVTQNNEAKKWNAAVLQNGGRTWGVMTSEKNLTDKQYDRLKKDIKEKYSGAENAGKPVLLEGGLHWEQVGLTSQDMDWLQGLNFSMREICAVYGTPPQLLGDPTSATYANYREANKAYYRGTIVPELASLREQLNRWLVPKFDRTRKLWLDFDLDGVEALQEDKAELWNRLNSTTFLTINEKRMAAGYEAIGAEGDTIFVPATNLPLDLATQPYEAPQEPPA